MSPLIYRRRLKNGFRWSRNLRLRGRMIRHARLKPRDLPYPRVVNNNACIRGVWIRFMQRVKNKHPLQARGVTI